MVAGTEEEYQSDAVSTKDITYLALTGDLWSVFCEYLCENWPRYNDTAMYLWRLMSKELAHWYAAVNWVIIGPSNGMAMACSAPSHNLNQWTLVSICDPLQGYLNQDTTILKNYLKENAFENAVWKIAIILSLPQYVNTS